MVLTNRGLEFGSEETSPESICLWKEIMRIGECNPTGETTREPGITVNEVFVGRLSEHTIDRRWQRGLDESSSNE